MLNNVPIAVSKMARNVIINHPNTWECQLYRKSVNRVGGALVGGLPTLGGMAVLNSEDEYDITFTHLGNGFALEAEMFQPSAMMDRQDANNGANTEFKFLIEPEMMSGMPGHFDVRNSDVMVLILADSVRLAFEIVGVETTLNIPPYVTRYIANRRGDLDIA